jgi:hypothetical protein
MAINTKVIKRRIKSISSTKKITKAMEMISAVKMRRAVANDLATRNYSELAWKLLESVAKKSPVTFHALLSKRPVKKIGIILITSNRGLAGGFTTKLLQEVHKFITLNQESNIQAEVILAGKKGRKIYQNFNHTVSAEFEKLDLTTHINQILPKTLLQPEAVVTLEDLVVGVERQLQLGVDEAFVQVEHQRREGHLVLHVVEDGVEALALLRAVAGDEVGVTRVLLVVQVAAEDLELLGEGGLGALLEIDRCSREL